MQNMTYLFHGIAKIIIAKIIIAKLIYIKLINNIYRCISRNNINLKKILTTCNINKCFEMTVKLNVIFIIFNGKNK